MQKKKDKYPLLREVVFFDAGAEGKAVGRDANGKIVFAAFAMPGDIADVQVVKKRKGFMEGRVTQFHKMSPDRREPFCVHFGTCGGCKWQHLPYALQLKYKQKQVDDNLQRICGPNAEEVLPIAGAGNETHYRNKLEYTFSNRRWLTGPRPEGDHAHTFGLGFHMPGMFDRILDIEQCWLQEEPSNEIRLAIRDFAIENGYTFYDAREQHGLLRNLILRNNLKGEWMLILVFHQNDKDAIENLLAFARDRFPRLTSIQYVINSKQNDSIADLKVRRFHGADFLTEEMEGLQFRIGPKSFFQTNTSQALRLYQIVREMAALKGDEHLYDLYTGTGTIALFLARHLKSVVGVEYVEEAVADARVNALENGIENTQFVAGDLGKMFDDAFVEKYGKPDIIISDPPRAGMHPKVIQQILKLAPEKIVYVSCNPGTQARDMEMLKETYHLKLTQAVDMFPQTQHVENVALLVRR